MSARLADAGEAVRVAVECVEHLRVEKQRNAPQLVLDEEFRLRFDFRELVHRLAELEAAIRRCCKQNNYHIRGALEFIVKEVDDPAIASKRVTYDFERQMEGATLLKCSEFGSEIIERM